MNTRTQTLLSTLWIFVILNIFARDIHELGRPGMLEQVMSGVVDGVVVTEGLMLLGGIMFEFLLSWSFYPKCSSTRSTGV